MDEGAGRMPWKVASVVLLLLAGAIGCDRQDAAVAVPCREGVDAFLEENDHARAVGLLSGCIDDREPSPSDLNFLLFMRGMAKLGRDDKAGALADLAAAVAADPDNLGNSRVHSASGHVHSLLGDYPQAVDQFGKGMAFGPVSARQFFARGLAHFGLGDFDAAARDFREGQALEPERAWHALWLYLAGARAGRADLAQLEAHRRAAADHASHAAVFDLFAGDLSPGALLEGRSDDDTRDGRLGRCDRLTYAAEFLVLQGDPDRALALLEEAAGAPPQGCVSSPVLQGELDRLRRRD